MTTVERRDEAALDVAEELDAVDPGRPAPELIPIDSLSGVHTGRWTFLVLDGAAFVMQAMHPVIGEITGRYSAAFHGDPGGRAIRSVDSVLRWTYGGQEAIAEGNRVRALHQPLRMKSSSGKQISALNPGAYQWVIITGYLVMSKAGSLLIGREFTTAEKEELIRDNRRYAQLLHVPMSGYPQTPDEYDAYFEKLLPVLEANPQALHNVEDLRSNHTDVPSTVPALLRPLVGIAARPFKRLAYLSIAGLLDPRLRETLGISWSAAEQRQLERRYTVIRTLYRILPDRLTYFPLAYHARKQHQCVQKMHKRQQKSFAYRLSELQENGTLPT